MEKGEQYTEGDIVEVRWEDPEDDPAWTSLEIVKLQKCPRCKTVGYFINEDENCIRLCYSVSEDMEVARSFIPKKLVKSIRKVEDSELDDFDKKED